ncbi:MAG TPA: hypothetical protein VMW17_17440 [Candidatus Binatia bacterium]|nr:hypothetical protein [Candidatus Binatia bacterium]
MPAAIRSASRSGVVLLFLCVSAWAAEPREIEYLTIEANEGGSSGGHAAIRLDDVVYDFQYHSPGVLRLQRAGVADFLLAYNILQNRGITVSRITVSDDTFTAVRSWFNRRFLTEELEFDTLNDAVADRALVELLLGRGDSAGLELRGTGYFFADGAAIESPTESAALVALRERVQQANGADFLARRRAALHAALTHLTLEAGGSFSRQYRDLMTECLALTALQQALPLQADSFRAPTNDVFQLDDDERVALNRFARQLEDELLALLHSPRPDWGFPLLVGMARLIALRQSIDSGRLVFLDGFAADAAVVPARTLRGRPAMFGDLLEEAGDELGASRAALRRDDTLGEAEFTRIESASTRVDELWQVAVGHRDVRVQVGPLMPARPARRTDVVMLARRSEELERALVAMRQHERDVRQRLEQRYAYNLVGHNCVSEIFRSLNAALAEAAGEATPVSDAAARLASEQTASRSQLGGFIEPGAALTFIPFVSGQAVRHEYRVTATEHLSSYRHRRMAFMYKCENPVLVFLRESNVFTSTVYARNPHDSFFVFFTDAIAARPLFGGLNLAAGLGASVIGLAAVPFDDGEMLRSGVTGVLFSLPELAFINLRKGTFDYVERRYRPVSLAATPAG